MYDKYIGAVVGIVMSIAAQREKRVAHICPPNLVANFLDFPYKHVSEKLDSELTTAISELTVNFLSLGSAIAKLYTSIVMAQGILRDHTEKFPNVQHYLSDPLPQQLSDAVDVLMSDMQEIIQFLNAISGNRLARQCWLSSVNKNAVALEYVKEFLLREGFSNQETDITAENLNDLTQFFSIAIGHLQGKKFSVILSAILAANSAEVAKQPYNHAALRSLIFGGNIIFAFVTTSKVSPDKTIIASWGTAILMDIFKGIPEKETIATVLKENFPQHTAIIDHIEFELSRKEIVGLNFEYAVSELEKRMSLLTLSLNK